MEETQKAKLGSQMRDRATSRGALSRKKRATKRGAAAETSRIDPKEDVLGSVSSAIKDAERAILRFSNRVPERQSLKIRKLGVFGKKTPPRAKEMTTPLKRAITGATLNRGIDIGPPSYAGLHRGRMLQGGRERKREARERERREVRQVREGNRRGNYLHGHGSV